MSKDKPTRESKGTWRVLRLVELEASVPTPHPAFAHVGPQQFASQAAAIKWIRNEAPAGTYTPVKCWPSEVVESRNEPVRIVNGKQVRSVK